MIAAMLANWTDWFVKKEFLGNALWQWASLLGAILASLVVGKVLAFFLHRQADRLGARQGWRVTELLLRAMEKPLILLVFAVGLGIVKNALTIDPDLSNMWDKVTKAMGILAGGWFIYRMVDIVEHYLRNWTKKTDTKLDDQLVPLIRKSLRVFVVIVVVLFVADNVLHWDIGALIAGLGIGGLALALASKDAISNLFGSVTIFADRPFQMGDRIKVAGHDGMIEEVGFRSTRIRTLDGTQVIIPNSLVANEAVENIGRRPSIKRILNVTVTYDTPPAKLKRGVEILNEMLAVRMAAFPEDYPPKVYFSDFNAASLNIIVYYWFSPPDWWQYMEFNHDFNTELLTRFNDEGIEFAFPTQTIYVKKDDAPADINNDRDDGEPRKGQAYT